MKSIFEKLMTMDEAGWARHANKWSVYTRYTVFPLLALAIWSRTWIGAISLIPVALVCLWAWLNPRLFPPPLSTRSWASKAVLGERIWLARRAVVPARDMAAGMSVLIALNAFSTLILAVGLLVLSLPLTLGGLIAVIIFKSWFLDRMVWLYEVSDEPP